MSKEADHLKEKRIVAGLLAHVDAGKTTLAEAMLYAAGCIQKKGSVDDGSTHLDTHRLEKQRGVTIFSSAAVLAAGSTGVTLLDTPGHVDFSAEMERTLAVLDYALLIVSGTEGVQAHTETLWQLLRRFRVPVFLFVTKMDRGEADKSARLSELRTVFGEGVTDFTVEDVRQEAAALQEERLLQEYLAGGALEDAEIARLIAERKLFPCYFGSGARGVGVAELLEGLDRFTVMPEYPGEFAARAFKVARDGRGERWTYLKITGGSLRARAVLRYTEESGEPREEKAAQLRRLQGARTESAEELFPGEIAVVAGLADARPGQAFGAERARPSAGCEPVFSCRVLPPAGCSLRELMADLREIEQEDPALRVVFNEALQEVSVQLMGEVQREVLKSLLQQRFGLDAELGEGRILYKETILNEVEGVGHFEPLRHYAEVQLRLSPGQPGSGLTFSSACSLDDLSLNWQRLILSSLADKQHCGVLTGAPLTDVRITLTAGKAHLKHTEGGDFREAACRALRQGLMQAESRLLEPRGTFRLEIPSENLGRALADLKLRQAEPDAPETGMERAVLTGSGSYAALKNYGLEVMAYTRGRGRFSLRAGGFMPCGSEGAAVAAAGYDPERDVANPADSIFCEHGAGRTVSWREAASHMDIPSSLHPVKPPVKKQRVSDAELEAILLSTVGPIQRPVYGKKTVEAEEAKELSLSSVRTMYIDGYNVIFAWPKLRALAAEDLGAARSALLERLSGYRAYRNYDITVVFDAYLTDRRREERYEVNGLHAVFTPKDEPADLYIAARAAEGKRDYSVCVVTSDHLIRLSALGSSALMMSSETFLLEVENVEKQVTSIAGNRREKGRASIRELTGGGE